jgi:hypothetical protein
VFPTSGPFGHQRVRVDYPARTSHPSVSPGAIEDVAQVIAVGEEFVAEGGVEESDVGHLAFLRVKAVYRLRIVAPTRSRLRSLLKSRSEPPPAESAQSLSPVPMRLVIHSTIARVSVEVVFQQTLKGAEGLLRQRSTHSRLLGVPGRYGGQQRQLLPVDQPLTPARAPRCQPVQAPTVGDTMINSISRICDILEATGASFWYFGVIPPPFSLRKRVHDLV